MRKLLLAFFCLLALPVFGALGPSTAPSTYGTVTAAGTVCSIAQTSGLDGYVVVLDGQAVATSTITVTISVLDPATAAYSAPVTIGGVTNPITVTNATTQVVTIPGGYAGIQVSVTSFGTATGTFNAWIGTY